MKFAKPLPQFLIARHRERRASRSPEQRARLQELATHGQTPRAMVIACCDSRVMVTDVFGSEAGEFFVHRNIANLVPPCTPDGRQHGTSATIEYAVTVLNVRHLIVMAHSQCGGVAGCFDIETGQPGAPNADSFVGHWLEVLAPSVQPLRELPRDQALRALEQQTVLVSLGNLMTFPFVSEAVMDGRLQLHGTWKDIGEGDLEVYDPGTQAFYRL
ncbi:carbonic anhydrase [uncultured Amaricoccus sp.]|uniref:carbonic anhydrase n=1 Tax=uncultured Amaricoccus sp. TaxID=339341 RepID=UPI00262E1434|nr:carbonic anhydrase [uncultured Amaricoccus sp.]